MAMRRSAKSFKNAGNDDVSDGPVSSNEEQPHIIEPLSRSSSSLSAQKPLDYKKDEDQQDLRYVVPKGLQRKVPKKAIAMAIVLFSMGCILLLFGLLTWFRILDPHEEGVDLSLLILGSITFLPGFYHTRIAYKAWKGRKGYSYDMIPDFN